METFSLYFVLFMIYSFMGWLMEVIVTLVKEHKFVNRGFLVGPYCPIYGYGCLLIILLLRKYESNLEVLFLMSIVICSILEYMTSLVMEKLFNARWWDYSDKKFNINGRVCLETMIPFGLLGTIIMYIVNPFYVNLLTKLPVIVLEILAVILLLVYVVDNIISFNVIKSVKDEIKIAKKDQTEEITKKIKQILARKSILHKRLIKAFPHIKSSDEILAELKKIIEVKKIKPKKSK